MTEPNRQAAAWGRTIQTSSSCASSSQTAVPEQSVRATEFPVLGTKAPSKAAARKRAVYALDRKTFDAYPPRNEVLALRQMEQQQKQLDEWRRARGGDLLNADGTATDDEEHRHPETSEIRQQYGMSSVTFYDKSGNRTNSRPAIYGKAAPRSGDATPTREMGTSSNKQQRRYGAAAAEEQQGLFPAELTTRLPHPMTHDRIDALMRETQRAQRARSARRRQLNASGQEERTDDADGAERPLMDELTRALSSVEGFLAAFGTASVSASAT